MYFDTHAHLNFEPFILNPQEYINRAREAGVSRMIIPSTDLASSEKAIALADRFDGVYAAVGIHPQDSAGMKEGDLAVLEEMLKHPKAVAVGEIGMDFYREHAPADVQERAFKAQVELARSLNYPMIVHNREADDATWRILSECRYYRAQFHCFGSDVEMAQKVIQAGGLISFTGVLTFSKKARAVAAELPLESLMIETDCPWMAPVPHRGKTNEPSFVVETAAKLGEVFGRSAEEIAKITTDTAIEFFKIKV